MKKVDIQKKYPEVWKVILDTYFKGVEYGTREVPCTSFFGNLFGKVTTEEYKLDNKEINLKIEEGLFGLNVNPPVFALCEKMLTENERFNWECSQGSEIEDLDTKMIFKFEKDGDSYPTKFYMTSHSYLYLSEWDRYLLAKCFVIKLRNGILVKKFEELEELYKD